MQPIDFTQCPRVVGKAYNGANGKKINYYDYLHDTHHPSVLSDMLTQLVPNIQALDVESLIL